MDISQRARAALGVTSDPQALIRSFLRSDGDTTASSGIGLDETDPVRRSKPSASTAAVRGTGTDGDEDDDGCADDDDESRGDDYGSGLVSPIESTGNSISASTPSLSLPDSFEVEYAGNLFDSKSLRLDVSRHLTAGANTATPAQFLRQLCGRCQDTQRAAALEKASLNSTITNLKKELSLSKMNADSTAAELVRVQKVAGITEENQRLEIAALEDRCRRLTNMLEAETIVRRQNEEKATKYDLAAADLSKLQKEAAELRSTMAQQAEAVKVLRESEAECKRTAQDSARVKDLLQLDKEHLQNELRSVQQQYDERCRAHDECHAQKLALDVKVAQLTDQILTLQLTARSGFDERMEKEVARLREESQREVEAMKATSKDIIDRENRVLREARASMESELQQLRHRNDLLSQQLGQVQMEMSNLHHEKNSTISELRAEVKMKAFELTQLGVNFEERMAQLRQGELELDVLRQELIAHKEALHRVESEAKSMNERLRAELDAANHRLLAYDAVEEEIDAAIMRSARAHDHDQDTGPAAAASAPSSAAAAAKGSAELLLQTVKGIPSNPERRVRQAVYLAQRLLETEKQRDHLQEHVKKLQRELREAQQQAEAAHENLARAAQPTSYLVSKLREEEIAKAGFINKCKVLDAELQQRKKSELEARQEAAHLRERLQSLLQQRGELQTVRAMLEQLHAAEAEDSDDDSSDAVDGDDDGDGNAVLSEPQSLQLTQQQATPPRMAGASEESKLGSPSISLSQHDHADTAPAAGTDSAARRKAATAKALGLSPEQLEQFTSPPRSIISQPAAAASSISISGSRSGAEGEQRISPVSYKREIL